MSLTRVAAAMIGLSLLGSPLLALYCNQTDSAAMACCRGGMSHCNMPGMTEDCCKRVPTGQDSQAPAMKAERLEKSRLGPLSAVPAVSADLLVAVPPLSASLHGTVPGWSAAPVSPPRSPILRV